MSGGGKRADGRTGGQLWVTADPDRAGGLDAACEAVLRLFDGTHNRVTLKIEMPQEHHFFVIGKKGEHMKDIMGATGCHVHFPDAARPSKGPGQHAKDQVAPAPLGVSSNGCRALTLSSLRR